MAHVRLATDDKINLEDLPPGTTIIIQRGGDPKEAPPAYSAVDPSEGNDDEKKVAQVEMVALVPAGQQPASDADDAADAEEQKAPARPARRGNSCNYKLLGILALGLSVLGAGAYFASMIGSGGSPGACTPLIPPTTYDVTHPWAGGESFCINSQNGLRVGAWQYSDDQIATTAPWGDLAPWNAKFSAKKTVYGNTKTLEEPAAGVVIPANDQACATFNFNASGILKGIPSPPKGDVYVNGEAIPLAGVQNCASNPVPNFQLRTYLQSWGKYYNPNIMSSPEAQFPNGFDYAFVGVDTSGRIFPLDDYADSAQLPAIAKFLRQNAGRNASLAFGGWNTGALFEAIGRNQSALNIFVGALPAALEQTGFTKITLDAEGMEAELFVPFHEAIASGLQAKNIQLQIAMTANPDEIVKLYDAGLCRLAPYQVTIQLMTYDYFAASFSGYVGPGAPTDLDPNPLNPATKNNSTRKFNLRGSLNAALLPGCFDPSQFLLGEAAYGYGGFVKELGTTRGLYQPTASVPHGEYDDPAGTPTGVWSVQCIMDGTCYKDRKIPAGTECWVEPYAQQMVCYTPNPTPLGYFVIVFDSPETIAKKTSLVLDYGLGGAFFWNANEDDQTGKLTKAAFTVLTESKPKPEASTAKIFQAVGSRENAAPVRPPEKSVSQFSRASLFASQLGSAQTKDGFLAIARDLFQQGRGSQVWNYCQQFAHSVYYCAKDMAKTHCPTKAEVATAACAAALSGMAMNTFSM